MAPDLVILGTGLNGPTPASNYTTQMLSFIASTKSLFANVPIVVTTQNPTTGSLETVRAANFADIATTVFGTTLPCTPALKESTSNPGVWLLDTRQAYSDNYTYNAALSVDGLHPNSAGYRAQSAFMFNLLTQTPPPTPPPTTPPNITTVTLPGMVRAVTFSQTIASDGSNLIWSISDGALPAGLTLDTSTGTIAGTPTQFGGTYSFTVRATNQFGYDDQTFSGPINPNALPFVANDQAKFKNRSLGYYYPITNKIKISGSFQTFIPRD